MLWYQKQLSEINAPLGVTITLQQANRNVVLGMQQSIKELMKQRDDTATQRSRYEQELTLTTEQRAAVRQGAVTVYALPRPMYMSNDRMS